MSNSIILHYLLTYLFLGGGGGASEVGWTAVGAEIESGFEVID